MSPSKQLTVAVHHPTDYRPEAPAFQALVDELNAQIAATVHGLGWRAEFFAGDRLSPAGKLSPRTADMIVIAGGEDVAPTLYGGAESYPGEAGQITSADTAHLQIIRAAVKAGTPLLGICRGMQLINVAFGGTLIQDMTCDQDHACKNHRAEGQRFAEQMGGLAPFVRTNVTAVLGSTPPDGVIPDTTVLCTHHQAVERLGAGLQVIAQSDDGVVEAVVHESAPVTGVQWHPEHREVAETQLISLLVHMQDQVHRQDNHRLVNYR